MVLPLAYAYCNVSLLPVRSEPAHNAEMVTQLLFGERVQILDLNNRDWAKVHCQWDDYEGWCKMSQLTPMQREEYLKKVKYVAGSNKDKLAMPEGEMWLPLGSELHGLKGGKIKPIKDAGKFKGKKINIKTATLSCDALKAAALHYMNAPYEWGGRSIAGLDCSGLTQMAFKLCNFPILRDASLQSTQGELVDFLQNARCGDLAFFENKEGKINHVGILLDDQTIIHSTETAGRVVIDRIDPGGIISVSLKKRTHNLRMVRRYF